jgi:hypothetical protein
VSKRSAAQNRRSSSTTPSLWGHFTVVIAHDPIASPPSHQLTQYPLLSNHSVAPLQTSIPFRLS